MSLNEKQLLCRGIIYHMLGLDENSRTDLGELESGIQEELRPLASAIQRYAEYSRFKGFEQESRMDHGEAAETPRSLLNKIVRGTCQLINLGKGDHPHLWNEEKVDARGLGIGLSRDPFSKITTEGEADDVALGAACYLLRGYANFFRRHRIHRNFDAAKLALNDFYQAHQLVWRLYHALDCDHHRKTEDGLERYLEKVLEAPVLPSSPAKTPYFLWSLILLCEIMRGNIYRQIDYLDESERHYRNARNRVAQVFRSYGDAHTGSKLWKDRTTAKYFITPTLTRAVFEMSKVQFDLGRMLESLASQTRCLQYLLATNSGLRAEDDLRRRLTSVVKFLEAERTQPIYDRELVTRVFGDSNAPDRGGAGISELLSPSSDFMTLCGHADKDFGPLIAEILSRMGFTLYTLRSRKLMTGRVQVLLSRNHRKQSEDWLRQYFRFDLVWNEKATEEHKVKGSPLGRYCETLLLDADNENRKSTARRCQEMQEKREENLPGEIDRRFALLLRQFVRECQAEEIAQHGQYADLMLDDKHFFRAILSSTTQNIGNIVTIPRRNARLLMRSGYKNRRSHGDLSKNTVYLGYRSDEFRDCECDSSIETGESHPSLPLDKFVVLRRWQSFSPKIPRPGARWLKGGGYYLLWKGKGIVIDPGYDFIQNFYDEGFSLEDINAIVLTHSHPDHDDDFASLTTLVKEWNEFHRKLGQGERENDGRTGQGTESAGSTVPTRTIRLDLFLNESTHWKFAAWLQATDVKIGRVISLPVVRWDKDTAKSEKGPNRGKNVTIDLSFQADEMRSNQDCYNMKIEVIPAWHDDVISKTAAVGLKFHLCNEEGDTLGVVGYTGDTGAYGLDVLSPIQSSSRQSVAAQYEECDVLVAHLGDIKLRELATAMKSKGDDWSGMRGGHPLSQLLRDWFLHVDLSDFKNKISDFLNFAITLDLVPSAALRATIETEQHTTELSVQEWFGAYLDPDRVSVPLFRVPPVGDPLQHMLRSVLAGYDIGLQSDIGEHVTWQLMATYEKAEELKALETDRQAYLLLEFLVACATLPYQYHYHLGIFGVHQLFKAMVGYWAGVARGNDPVTASVHTKVFVVGELPEELTSYRHLVANWLNMTEGNLINQDGPQLVRAFTGDIGLHIGLSNNDGTFEPRIRCTFCNYNNEIVLKREHYHDPNGVLELAVKRLDSAMIYLCKKNGHHPVSADDGMVRQFLSSPPLRVI